MTASNDLPDRSEGLSEARPRIVLAEANPWAFIGSFFELLRKPVELVLVDPGLPSALMESLLNRLEATRARNVPPGVSGSMSGRWRAAESWKQVHDGARVWIATGGTSGVRRFAVHSKRTLQNAAEGFCRVFPGPADSLCILPLWHVGGLMQLVRAAISDGEVRPEDWRDVESGQVRPEPDGSFLSLVPAQLERLLAEKGSGRLLLGIPNNNRPDPFWLRGFRAVFLGGAGARPALLARARALRIPLAPAYGMTETGAQVTVLLPEAFLAGSSGVGRSLPHAVVSIVDEMGRPVPSGEVGFIRIEAGSLFLGYENGGGPREGAFLTGDLGRMNESGELTVVGRADDRINTGGEKVVPGEVEAILIESGLAADAVVFGRSDPSWGEVVCAVLEGGSFTGAEAAREFLRERLPAFQIPKKWIRVARLPRNAMGKLDRSWLEGLSDDLT